jgi:hypothetical protein
MKAMIATRDPKNGEEMRAEIQQVWPDLTIETIHALVAEFPRRLKAASGREGRTLQHF